MIKYTDQEFTYRETPVSYDGIAKLDSVKGNTVVWNQLVENGNFVDTSGWSFNNPTSASVSNNTLTVSANADASMGFPLSRSMTSTQGHKYLIMCDVRCSQANQVRARYPFISTEKSISADAWTRFSEIGTATAGQTLVGIQENGINGATYKYKNFVCFDLTAMFGSGNEPTAEEFTKLYSLPYYSYEKGKLLSFNGSGIKTVGFNQWEEVWEVGAVNSANGANESASDRIRSKNYIKCLPNTEYFYVAGNQNLRIIFYDANKSYISYFNYSAVLHSFTTPSNCCYMRFNSNGAYGSTYNHDICINISSSENGKYEPYTSSTTSIPTSTYFPTGMKSAGSVYDELSNNKAITRLIQTTVDGTNKTASYYGTFNGHHLFYIDLFSSTQSSDMDGMAILSNHYTTVNISAMDDMCIRYQGSLPSWSKGRIYWNDDRYTSASAMNTALQSDPLEIVSLAQTPTEQDINADLFYKFYGGGTEEILPTNGSTPTTSAFLGDIEYYTQFDSEVPYRKFWMVNSKGEEWSLTEKDFRAFLNNPTGLGFKKQIDMVRYGERAVKSNETYDFPTVQGELLFYDSANSNRYDNYHRFTRFLMDQPITLYYQIPVSFDSQIADIYSLDCEVTEVQKTESKTDRILRSTITINGLSFYIGDEITITGTGTSYTIENNGDFPVGFEIQIDGTSLKNPYFTLEQDGELYGEAKFDYFETVPTSTFSNVYVNSNDGQQEIVLKQSGTILPNPLSYQDLSISNGNIYVTFVKLAKGVSTLTIGKDSGTLSNVTIKYAPAYRSV